MADIASGALEVLSADEVRATDGAAGMRQTMTDLHPIMRGRKVQGFMLGRVLFERGA